jgi:dsDNA-binding SOS-regulon protein
MQTAEFNHEDFSNTAEADKSLLVRFFYKNVQNKLESQQLGRPVFKEKTYIEIRVAGQRDVQACRPVTYADKQRFPRHYEAFEKRVEPPTEGMPLIEFPAITRTQAEELSFMNVKTVEQLASMKDANLSKFMNGYKLRDQAVKWLESNTLAVDDAEKEELRATVADMKDQIAKLMEMQKPSKETMVVVENLAAKMPSQYGAEITPELTSTLDETPIEGEAIAVPAAPAGLPKRKSRRATK